MWQRGNEIKTSIHPPDPFGSSGFEDSGLSGAESV